MNYDQAKEYSLIVPWKTTTCSRGSECLCRMIVPVEPIYYTNLESDNTYEYCVVGNGVLDQTTAEHITLLHNEHCERVRKETINSMIVLNEKEVEIFEKFLTNKYKKIVRKEVD